MTFHGLIAVTDAVPIRVLVDAGAKAYHLGEQFHQKNLGKSDIAVRDRAIWLILANGSQTVSKDTCVLPLDIQTYQTAIECCFLPMSD